MSPKPKPKPRRPAGAPRSLPQKWWALWAHPWWEKARTNREFKRWLLAHGYLSPHFRIREAGGQDRNPLGTALPKSMWADAQHHAFRLERLRHRLGDQPLSPLSWYRNPRHNSSVGGASQSRHMEGDATDFDSGTVARFGAARFDRECEHVFADGGFGRYPSGSRHVDSRGHRARW